MADSCRPVSRRGRYNATGPSSVQYTGDVSSYGNVDFTPSEVLDAVLSASIAFEKNITKEGIGDAVLNEIVTFHQDSLNDILSPEQILNNDLCSQCKNENILPCPTRGICIVKTGLCSFHYCQQKQYRPCPKHICDRLRENIKRCHKFNFPSWKNTKAEGWCQNPWELAKCYLPPDGYLGVSTIEETDINGIVSVIMNHSAFKNKADMRICDEVREVTRKVRHSPDLCINDHNLNYFVDTLDNFLRGSSLFQGDLKAAASVQKLSKLKKDSITITTNDVTKVLQDVIHENTRRSLQVVNESLAERAREMKVDLDKLEEVASTSIKDIFTAKASAIGDIKVTQTAAIDDIDKAKTQTVAEIKDLKHTSIEDEYQRLKANIKSDLLAFNQRHHSTIPLSPLFEEHDTPIQGFYVQPNMNLIEVQKTTFSGPAIKVRQSIKSLQDVFCKKSKNCENIYLTSGAGQGKTVFCKYMVLTWCHAHGNHVSESRLFTEEDIRVMRNFEYIFLVSLRDCGMDCDIDDIIVNQVIQNLGHSYTTEFMQKLLNREKYLVLLDGLDEWSHPVHNVSPCKKTQDGLPHRKARQHCTILTTTRSWKLGVVNLKSSQIDNHIEIGDLEEDNSRQLIANAVRKILKQNEGTKTKNNDKAEAQIWQIETEISSRSTPEFETNPLLLTYMICLLCDGKSLGRSKCELYANILDFLIHRRKKRNSKSTNTVNAKNTYDSVLLPAVFKNCSHTRTLEKFLISLGQLAFQTLFCEHEERSLVFESSLMDSCLTEEEQTLSLSAGILIQNQLPGRFTERETTVSFSHKTFQEFFAALYIYSKDDLNDVIEQVLKKCNSLENILEMSNVFIFLSGISPERLHTISKCLSIVINDDTIITEYRSARTLFDLDSHEPVKNLQNMYIACVKESQNAKHVPVYPLLQDAIIDRESNKEGLFQMLQNLIITNIANMKSIWLIHCESEMDTQELIRDLDIENIHTLESLQLDCPIASEDLERILAGSVNTLKQVIVYSWLIESRTHSIIYSTLSDTSLKSIQNMQYLISLHLINLEMSHHLLDSLISHLNQRTCMRQVVLSNIKCIDHDESCPGFSMNISQHAQLTSVGLGILPLVHVEINTSTLETCEVGSLQTISAVSSSLNSLPEAKKLRSFFCYSMSNDLNTMMAIIPQLVTVTDIVIGYTNMKNKALQLHPGNVNIKFISMQNTTVSCLSLEQLVQQVQQFQQSVRVELRDCTVTPTEEYERMKYNIKSSDRFEVICDGEEETISGQKLNAFIFRTNKT